MNTLFEFKDQGRWSYICYPALEEAGVFHGFVTRPRGGGEEQVERAVKAFSLDPHILMNQEHGDSVHLVERGERPTAGDGLILLEKNVAGIIKTADCLPVIIYALSVPAVAIVHAGWRGTALGIAGKAAMMLIKALGVSPKETSALIGPGIGPCCYNVQEDVARVFREQGLDKPVIQERHGSLFLDLKAANTRMLRNEGVNEIHDVDLCTSCRQDLFYSARRDKGRGRQINFAVVQA